MILDIAIIVFVIMEATNVAILYLNPGTKIGNGIGVFDAWDKSKKDDGTHLFSKYMVNWVGNTKLIFIVLLLVILFTGTEQTKVFAVIAMIISIAAYFVKLHPIIKKLDEMGEITPKGYSKGLFFMILGFVVMFSIALILHFIF